jgi:dihydrodipicolinate synthase/N-acetylneuraminate lyase
MLLYWDAQWRLDQETTDANLDRQLASDPHGLYSLDTASEFFTLEFEDWQAVARRFVKRCRSAAPGLLLGLGCTWTHQEGALARIRVARDLGVDTIHLSPPYWLPLNEDGLLRFLGAVQEVAGHLGVILYAPPHGKLTLSAALYEKLARANPCVIGTKTEGLDALLLAAPGGERRHSHFVHESRVVNAARHGGLGIYSALAGVSMALMKHWWKLIEEGRWPEAVAIQDRVNRFYAQGVQPIRDRGILAGAIDKSMAQVGGAAGTRLMRPPYPSVPDDLFDGLLGAARRHLPEAFG